MKINIDSNAIYDILKRGREEDSDDEVKASYPIGTTTETREVERAVIIPRTELPIPFSHASGSFYRWREFYSGGVNLFLPNSYGISMTVKKDGFFNRLFRRSREVDINYHYFLAYIKNKLKEDLGKKYKPSKIGIPGFILDDNGRHIFSIERFDGDKEEGEEDRLWVQIGGSGPIRRRFTDQIDFGKEISQLSNLVNGIVNRGIERAVSMDLIEEEDTKLDLRLGPNA